MLHGPIPLARPAADPYHRRLGFLTRSWQHTLGPLFKRRSIHHESEPVVDAPEEIRVDPNTDLNLLSEHELYVLTQQLKDEEANVRPLISSTEPLANLRAEYENGGTEVPKRIDWLETQGWKGVRRTRGDGDCFYRSFAYSFVERIMYAEDVNLAVASARSVLGRTLPLLEQAGFEKFAYEDFYETFIDVIEMIVRPDQDGKRLDAQSLLSFFQTPELSNSVVVFLRLVASAQMRAEPDDYAPFLTHPDTFEPLGVREFCERFVEACGKEADEPQIIALTRALSISVQVAYLAGSHDRSVVVNFVKFEPEGCQDNGAKPVVLLYRPGHYDILEARADDLEQIPTKKADCPV